MNAGNPAPKEPSRQVRRHELWLRFKKEMYETVGGEGRAQCRRLARAKVKTVYAQEQKVATYSQKAATA